MIDFEQVVKEYMQSKRREQKPYDNILYASELGQCKRKIFYKYKQPKDVPEEALSVFEMGNLTHEKLEEILKGVNKEELGIDKIYTEIDYPIIIFDGEPVRIGGRLDGLLILKDGSKIVVEFKSIGSSKWKKAGETIDSFSMLSEPKPEHVIQSHLYMFSTGARKSLIIYCDKNTFRIKQFEVNYDKDILNKAVDRAKDVNKSLVNDLIPIPESKMLQHRRWECNYCAWKEECDEYERIKKQGGKDG